MRKVEILILNYVNIISQTNLKILFQKIKNNPHPHPQLKVQDQYDF